MTRRALPWVDARPHPRTILRQEPFASALHRYAADHGQSDAAVHAEAESLLDQMLASHRGRIVAAWSGFGRWMLRAHDVVIDEEQIVALRALDRASSLAFVFSHRSYLDGLVLPLALASRRFGATYTVGGANLDLPVFGQLASQSGMIFIRRSVRDSPLYRTILRNYIALLARRGENLAWSIEGGRTRTGKLRPPTHGLLHYLALAVDDHPSTSVHVVPVSIVYDQLHEVPRMTGEARGLAKRPEDLAWLVSMARSQRRRLGRAYLSFGTPIPLRERLSELRSEGVDESQLVERIALDASHRINRVTAVTVTAVVCLVVLGADRALTFDQVLQTVSPLADYIVARGWPVAGGATLTDRSTIRRALHELVDSGVVDVYEGGAESVWQVADGQHLVAAFYRNTLIHFLVDRAISEVALIEAERIGRSPALTAPDRTAPNRTAPDRPSPARTLPDLDPLDIAWMQALALRDLFKFEFFFPRRREFETDLLDELTTLAPGRTAQQAAAEATAVLAQSSLFVGHHVLRPFVDAYSLLADRLCLAGGADVAGAEREELLQESLRLGEQWVRQRRIASAESLSLELLRTGLKLVDHRGLLAVDLSKDLDPAPADEPAARADLAARRTAFREELARLDGDLATLAALAQRTSTADGLDAEVPDGAR